jgi:hypothetical protein
MRVCYLYSFLILLINLLTMRCLHYLLLLILAGGFGIPLVQAQVTTRTSAPKITTKFDQHEAFAPFFYPAFGDEVRAADGTPGPAYWQNKVDYKIDVVLDDSLQTITGGVSI